MKCPDCKIDMKEKHLWAEPSPPARLGQSYEIKTLYQCPKCKRIEVNES